MRKLKFKSSIVSNLQVVMDFVKEIEAATGRKLTSIDIGGGLSSTYKDSEEPEAFAYRKYRHIFFKKVIWRFYKLSICRQYIKNIILVLKACNESVNLFTIFF